LRNGASRPFLTPFKNREEARAALIAEGCQIEAVSA
jgi:hypothetical protein